MNQESCKKPRTETKNYFNVIFQMCKMTSTIYIEYKNRHQGLGSLVLEVSFKMFGFQKGESALSLQLSSLVFGN